MKLSDYIVDFLVQHQITEFFGYQGTMIAHFADSVGKHPAAQNHCCYHEQGAAFAACGQAAATGKPAMAYATSGPGAVNLISGIANAYYDSLPVIFITGQINTYEYRDDIPDLRQAGFQETKIVEMTREITKYTVQLREAENIRYELEKAFYMVSEGRKGPVLLDIPMNLQRADIDPKQLPAFQPPESSVQLAGQTVIESLRMAIEGAQRPVLLLGNGIDAQSLHVFVRFAETLQLPMVTSLLAKSHIPAAHPLNFGCLGGAYGHRYANMIVDAKSDQLIAAGISLCTRQTGTNVSQFAPNAKLLRFDIDPAELKRKVKPDETAYQMHTKDLADLLLQYEAEWSRWKRCSGAWLDFCKEYKDFVLGCDDAQPARYPNKVAAAFNKHIQNGDIIVSDVGQHMMWVGQSINAKPNQTIIFSGGHGAMGFALPAALGASVAYPDKTIYCFCGDGAFQMNIQELQWLKNEQRNIVVVVFNNNSLGMITQLQTAYFDGKYHGTAHPLFTSPSFAKIALAYGIDAKSINAIDEIDIALAERQKNKPFLLEFIFEDLTMAYPKTILGARIYNQEPAIPEEKLRYYLEK